ncbi:hypothetical protein AALP_AA5G098000 [Arabis alpina]|uniref:F-box associated beta-propeller type 3 domain-containing protein n=1 Tax=Arabis alpina TaxID=50452 RepID=A0A087GW15_ARAAL|nr:hypothetical protein AALP_AA5G098000 [Arabis alpina]
MERDSIPTDLIIEILSRLTEKSIARFYCLFLTRSQARPRIVFALEISDGWSFYSLPQLQKPVSCVVAADFHVKFPQDQINLFDGNINPLSWSYASGLICLSDIRHSAAYENKPLIINPNTGQYAIIPELTRSGMSSEFLGFDPIDKQFKVLSMCYPDRYVADDHRILTLGSGEMSWRKIQSPLTHCPWNKGLCINGVLYYRAASGDVSKMIVCFDIRSEKFKFINAECLCILDFNLINYKGKLGVIGRKFPSIDAIELYMWDVEKHEWLKYAYTLLDSKIIDLWKFSIVGVIATGEIVLSMDDTSEPPFYVIYFNPERNTLQHVEIQGLGENCNRVYTFVDHAEDLNVHDGKLLMSSISAPSMKNKGSGKSSWRTTLSHRKPV